MNKILKPYTIVPSELYVLRDADRQLKNIIDDMGRPGYVLVSRQMGKTNLILNAKRELETENDIFIYIDLSNPFISARDCFENIIDIALETNSDKFEKIEKELLSKRKLYRDSDIPAHKQHSNELRLLLNSIPGKIVIVLDEIDALTKTEYSDQIFSQIRSIYFSRVNYKEFYRLTYILSGVVEPTEIIKDSKISPFNIGQKIYLNDFSKIEFENFIEKSKLKISNDVADRIFYWANGNPRMSWDICSELETISEAKAVKINDVDEIVTKLFLTSYDRPPVDNIREIVRNDLEIRDALVEIDYGKGNLISDVLKNKLYLAGIINYDKNKVYIKNRIIRQSLNPEWLRSLDTSEKNLLDTAQKLIEAQSYKEGISAYEKYLQSEDIGDELKSVYYYEMAEASINIKEYKEAISFFNKTTFEENENQSFYFRTLVGKGLCHYRLKQSEDAYDCFYKVTQKTKHDDIYLRGLLNLASLISNPWFHDKSIDKNQAIELYKQVIHEANTLSLKGSFIDEVKTLAYYNLGNIYFNDSKPREGSECFDAAIESASDLYKPGLILEYYEKLENNIVPSELINKLIDVLKSKKLSLNNKKDIAINFDENILNKCLLLIYESQREIIFKQLLTDIQGLTGKETDQEYLEIALFALSENKIALANDLLKDLLEDSADQSMYISPTTEYTACKYYSYLNFSEESVRYAHSYIDLFLKYRSGPIDIVDLTNFRNLISYHQRNDNFSIASKLISIIKKLKNEIDPDIAYNLIVFEHFELVAYSYLHSNEAYSVINKAQQFLKLINDKSFKYRLGGLLNENDLDFFKSSAQSVVGLRSVSTNHKQPVFSNKQIVKVKYLNGKVVEKKYKFLHNDIEKGLCFLIE